jgi:hypothetical protein
MVIKKRPNPKISQYLKGGRSLCIYYIPGKYSHRNFSRGGVVLPAHPVLAPGLRIVWNYTTASLLCLHRWLLLLNFPRTNNGGDFMNTKFHIAIRTLRMETISVFRCVRSSNRAYGAIFWYHRQIRDTFAIDHTMALMRTPWTHNICINKSSLATITSPSRQLLHWPC